MIRLTDLAAASGASLAGADVEVTGIAVDSRHVRPGDLFVAQRGARSDGLAFLAEARQRGAVALCADRASEALPTLVVPDARAVVPMLAAIVYGHPARDLRLVGITGTLGKTSTALLIQSALEASGSGIGVIGSLGVRVRGRVRETGMTTPDAPTIHRALRLMADAGVRLAAMEVTSHALALGRVRGLSFALGVLTNLVLDEHLEFHRTPEDYLRTKLRFFDLLEPGAPLVYNRDDARVAEAVERDGERRPRPAIGVSLAGAPAAAVVLRGMRSDASGSAFALEIVRPFPTLDGAPVVPQMVPLVLPVFGLQQVANAALAATAALIAGVPAETIAFALAGVEPMHRRMHILYEEGPVLLDDTVGNPESIRAVFEAMRSIPHHNLRVAYAIRGSRGVEVNERNAEALAREVGSMVATLIVTASDDHASERDRVEDEERDAVLRTLEAKGVPYLYEPTLEGAVTKAVEGAARGDLVALLGAQGRDKGAQIAKKILPPPVD